MKRLSTAVFVSGVVVLAGCSGAGQATGLPGSEATAFAAAGEAFQSTASLTVHFASDVLIDNGSVFHGVWYGNKRWLVDLSYEQYTSALGNSGWTELDAFKEKAGGWGSNVLFMEDQWLIGDNFLRVGGHYKGVIGDKTLFDVSADFGLFTNAGSVLHIDFGIAVEHYLMDQLLVGADYSWNRYTDPSGLSYQFIGVDVKYLLDMDSPLMLGLRYEREHANVWGVDSNKYALEADWYITDKVMTGISAGRLSGDFGEAWLYDVEVGYKVMDNMTVTAGYGRQQPLSGSGNNDFRVGAEMQF